MDLEDELEEVVVPKSGFPNIMSNNLRPPEVFELIEEEGPDVSSI